MTAIDTNAWVAFLRDDGTSAAKMTAECVATSRAILLPVVVTEILTAPDLQDDADLILSLPLLEIQNGFWYRAGNLRAALFRRGLRPKLADTLIAQMCIDHNLPLLTADRDFRAFERHAGLRLA